MTITQNHKKIMCNCRKYKNQKYLFIRTLYAIVIFEYFDDFAAIMSIHISFSNCISFFIPLPLNVLQNKTLIRISISCMGILIKIPFLPFTKQISSATKNEYYHELLNCEFSLISLIFFIPLFKLLRIHTMSFH